MRARALPAAVVPVLRSRRAVRRSPRSVASAVLLAAGLLLGACGPGSTASRSASAGATTAQRARELVGTPRLTVTVLRRDRASAPAYKVVVAEPLVAGLSSPGARRRIDATLAAAARGLVARFVATLAELSAPVPGVPTPVSSLDCSARPALLTPVLVAVALDCSEYVAGAASSSAFVETFDFDATSGQRLGLASLFRPRSPYLLLLSAQCRQQLEASLGSLGPEAALEAGTAPVATSFSSFLLAPGGLEIVFAPGQVAPLVAGTVSVTLPYAALARVERVPGPLSTAARVARTVPDPSGGGRTTSEQEGT